MMVVDDSSSAEFGNEIVAVSSGGDCRVNGFTRSVSLSDFFCLPRAAVSFGGTAAMIGNDCSARGRIRICDGAVTSARKILVNGPAASLLLGEVLCFD